MDSIGVTIDPEIDSSSAKPMSVYQVNGNQTTYRSYPANNVGVNSITWSIQAPSMGAYLNRAIMTRIPVTLTFAGTAGGNTLLLQKGMDALRSYADMRMLLTQTVTINGCTLNSSVCYDTYPDILAHYNHEYQKIHPLGAIDPNQEYSYAVGAINNPLSDYSTSETYEQGGLKRGAYPITSDFTNTSTAASITFYLTSWIYVPNLLGADCVHDTGLIRIRNIDVNYTLDTSSLVKVWSHDNLSTGHGTISSSSIALGNACMAYCKWITPPSDMKPTGNLHYKHMRMERFANSYSASLAVGASTTLDSNNIQLPNVPHYVYVYVREADNYKTINKTDTFGSLTNVSFDFHNQSALLSSASQQDLFMMSKDCGLIDNLTMFSGECASSDYDGTRVGTVGTLCCFEFGRHISLGDNSISVGSAGQYNFMVHCTVKNVNQTTAITMPTLYIIVAYDQELIMSEGGDVTLVTPIVPTTFSASGEGNVIQLPYDDSGQFGGSFKSVFGKIKNFFRKTQLISKIGSVLAPMLGPMGGPLASTALNMVRESGYGEDGGKTLGKSELKKLIRKL